MKNTHIGIITRLSSSFAKKFISKLSSISSAILSMKGRVTMLGISRWEEKFSYKTVERFFDEKIDWLKLSWAFIKSEIGEEVILVAAEQKNKSSMTEKNENKKSIHLSR
jgi:hypothetical protein